MDAVSAGGLGGTFSGNPVACAAALGVFEEIERHGLLPGRPRDRRGDAGGTEHALRDECDAIGDVRGRGAMVAIELVEPGGGRVPGPRADRAGSPPNCHREVPAGADGR